MTLRYHTCMAALFTAFICTTAVYAAPQPVLFYDFETGIDSNIVNRGSISTNGVFQNYDGTERVAGAPNGSSPGGGVFLEGEASGAGFDHILTGLGADALGIHDTNTTNLAGVDYTCTAWINYDKIAGDSMIFGQPGSGNGYLHHGIRGSRPHFGQWSDDLTANYDYTGLTPLTTGAWHHVTYHFEANGEIYRIFVDGMLAGRRASDGAADDRGVKLPNPVAIGAANSANQSFGGFLDDVAIFTNELSVSQIQFLATGGSPTNLPEALAFEFETWTAPHGTNNTWNMYAVAGGPDGPPVSWYEGYLVSTTVIDVAGMSYTGHLASVQSRGENEFLRQLRNLHGIDVFIGLTDNDINSVNLVFPGAFESHDTNTTVQVWRTNGWVYTSGEPYTAASYQQWGGNEPNDSPSEDAIEIVGSGNWNDVGSGIPGSGDPVVRQLAVIEWEINAPLPVSGARLLEPTLPPPHLLPGPVGAAGSFGGIWVRDNGNVGNGRQALDSLLSGNGTIITTTTNVPVINAYDPERTLTLDQDRDIGLFPVGSAFFGNDPTTNDVQNVALYKGEIVVSPAEAGTWTIGVTSDDGFALRVGDNAWTKAYNNAWIDHADKTVLTYEYGGVTTMRGVMDLPAGTHTIELLIWQATGGTQHELFAAKGDFENDADTDTWRLIGHQSVGPIACPGVIGDWTVITTSNAYTNAISNLATAEQALTATNWTRYTNTHSAINFEDPTDGGGTGSIPGDVPFDNETPADDNDFALRATGLLEIPTNATYLIGFQGDDGSDLQIVSQAWDNIYFEQNAASDIVGDRLVADFTTGNSRTIGAITLTAGVYQVETRFFERAGGAYYEIFGGDAVTTTEALPKTLALKLIQNGGATSFIDSDGLQLRSETSDLAIVHIAHDPDSDAVTLRWLSEAGASYDVLFNTESDASIVDWDPATWTPIATGVASQGETTEVTLPDAGGTPWRNISRYWIFRIKKN